MQDNPKISNGRKPLTAFVMAGGGSFGAVQVGMLKALTAAGITCDIVAGSSVGAINGAYYAGRPDAAGVAELEKLWRRIGRNDIFPITLGGLARFAVRRDYVVNAEPLTRLISSNIPFPKIEQTKLPLLIIATDILSGGPVVLTSGDATKAIVASCAIPAAFPPVKIGKNYLADGGIANNTPIRMAVEHGATRLVILPTGYACSLTEPPKGAVASALHALTLLIAGQLVSDLQNLSPDIDYHVVPSLCPIEASAYDFSSTATLIDRAEKQTNDWLKAGGMSLRNIPPMLSPHSHAH